MKRKYQKFYNRDLPIYAAEYWYWGEKEFMPKMIENVTHYEPLFYYQKDLGAAIYYDMNNDDTALIPMINLFKNKPSLMKLIADDYKKAVQKARELLKNPQTSDWEKMYELNRQELLPPLSIFMSLSNVDEPELEAVMQIARSTRDYDDKILYELGEIMFQMVAERFQLGSEFAGLLTHEEISKDQAPSKETLQRRADHWILLDGQLYDHFFTFDDFCQEHNLEIIETQELSDDIEGKVAQSGIARGRVKIVHLISQLNKVEKGDILVSPMTTPDFMPAIYKASALITDEGSLLCHAAIVSRELGIPCIIGTKIATSVLKDGMEVEVDAEKGVVKILQ